MVSLVQAGPRISIVTSDDLMRTPLRLHGRYLFTDFSHLRTLVQKSSLAQGNYTKSSNSTALSSLTNNPLSTIDCKRKL